MAIAPLPLLSTNIALVSDFGLHPMDKELSQPFKSEYRRNENAFHSSEPGIVNVPLKTRLPGEISESFHWE